MNQSNNQLSEAPRQRHPVRWTTNHSTNEKTIQPTKKKQSTNEKKTVNQRKQNSQLLTAQRNNRLGNEPTNEPNNKSFDAMVDQRTNQFTTVVGGVRQRVGQV